MEKDATELAQSMDRELLNYLERISNMNDEELEAELSDSLEHRQKVGRAIRAIAPIITAVGLTNTLIKIFAACQVAESSITAILCERRYRDNGN